MLHTFLTNNDRDFGCNIILGTCILDSLELCRFDLVELTLTNTITVINNCFGLIL